MQLDSLTMDRSAAREAFLEYRQSFRDQQLAVDGELMRGYRALADGRQVIRLSTAISTAGVDDAGRPRLAVARADERAITFMRRAQSLTFTPDPNRSRLTANRRFFIPDVYPAGTKMPDSWQRFWADIPFIPPRFRPPHSLANYTLLWEPVWRIARVRAPRDPALLKPIGGDLYAVLAVWDLTPLEAAVLDLRRG